MLSGLGGWFGGLADGIAGLPGKIVSGLSGFFDKVVDAVVSVGKAVLSLPGLIYDAFEYIIQHLIDAVVAVAGAVWSFFKNPIGSIVDSFQSLLDFLGGLVKALVDAIGELLKALFVPSDKYFDNKINALNKTLQSRIKTQDYEELLHSLQLAGRARAGLPNLTVTLWGQTVTVVDFGFYAKYQSTIYGWVRGVMFVLLLFYNVNNIYKLVRRDTLQNGSGSTGGGGDNK